MVDRTENNLYTTVSTSKSVFWIKYNCVHVSMKERAQLTQDPESSSTICQQEQEQEQEQEWVLPNPVQCAIQSCAHETDQYSPAVSSMVMNLPCKETFKAWDRQYVAGCSINPMDMKLTNTCPACYLLNYHLLHWETTQFSCEAKLK